MPVSYTHLSTMVDEYYVDEDGKRISNQWIGVENDDDWDDESPETYWYYYGKEDVYKRQTQVFAAMTPSSSK